MAMWQQILQYLFIKKKHPDAPKSIDLKLMHGMNRISILIFLIAVIVMLVRLLRHA